MKKIYPFLVTILLFALSIHSVVAQISPVYVGPRGSIHDDPTEGIYVSPDGNDASATGSITLPYKSINAALGKAGAGGTVILRGGIYREGAAVRIRNSNITIKSRKGEWAIIELPIKNPDCGESSTFTFDPEVSHCKLQSVEVIGGFYAVCLNSKWAWHGPDDEVAASDILIEDCKLHDSKYEVVKVKPNCNNVTIRYNEIYNSGRAELGTDNWLNGDAHGEAIDNVNGHNMKVQNNYMHDLNIGLYAKGGATDLLIENNLIENVLGAGIQLGFDTNLEWFDSSANPDYYENIRGVVCNNLIINAGWEGIGLYASKDAKVYNNTVVNAVNGRGQYHSALYFGVVPQDGQIGYGHPANLHSEIHHNIVCQSATSNKPMIEIRYSLDCGGMSAYSGMPAMHDNCYYITGKSAKFNDQRPGSKLDNAGFIAWKSHISGDNGSIEADPAFNANYMPTNTQCTGMGISYPLILNPKVGIPMIHDNENIQVYPNPTKGELRIEIAGQARNDVQSVEIFDIYGRKVYDKFPSNVLEGWQPQADGVVIYLTVLPAGIYFLKITTEQGGVTKKVVKQ